MDEEIIYKLGELFACYVIIGAGGYKITHPYSPWRRAIYHGSIDLTKSIIDDLGELHSRSRNFLMKL